MKATMGQITPTPRPVTPTNATDALKPLVKDLETIIGTAGDVLIDRAAFVASDEPVNPLSSVVRQITRLNCRIWAQRDKGGYSDRVNTYNSGVCAPFLASIGEGVQEGSVGPQFEGGQCSTLYQVLISAEPANPGSPGAVNSNFKTWGPIAGWRTQRDGVRIRGFITSSGPITASSCAVNGGFPFPTVEQQVFDVADRNQRDFQFQILGVCSGADNCGDPPPVITPPGRPRVPNPLPPNLTVNLPGLGPVEVTVDLDPDGDPVICLPGLDTCINIELGGGDDDGQGGGGGGTPGDETDPGDAGDPSDTGDGGDAEGEAEEGEELVGLLVDVLSAGQNPPVFQRNASTVYRGIGYVRMGYPNRLGVDISGGTVISPQFFHAQQRGLTAWAVSANVGFNLRVTPYYRELES